MFQRRQDSEESVAKPGDSMSGIRKVPMNIPKMEVQHKRKRRRTRKKIKKLFDKLRSDTNITIDSSHNSTVILLNDTMEHINSVASPNNKRKHSDTSFVEQNKCMKVDVSAPVVIADDTLLDNNVEPCPKDDDVIITDTDPNDNVLIANINKENVNIPIANTASSSDTPRKAFAPPMNCSTPISKSNTNIPANNNAESAQNLNVDINVTKEINRDSFLTIDLTAETDPNRSSISKTQFDTVIDLDNTQDSQDCTFVSISNASLSMSGDSDVTVLRNTSRQKINKFVSGIAKLDASEKGRLLEMITQKIFNGCKVPAKISNSITNIKVSN